MHIHWYYINKNKWTNVYVRVYEMRSPEWVYSEIRTQPTEEMVEKFILKVSASDEGTFKICISLV